MKKLLLSSAFAGAVGLAGCSDTAGSEGMDDTTLDESDPALSPAGGDADDTTTPGGTGTGTGGTGTTGDEPTERTSPDAGGEAGGTGTDVGPGTGSGPGTTPE